MHLKGESDLAGVFFHQLPEVIQSVLIEHRDVNLKAKPRNEFLPNIREQLDVTDLELFGKLLNLALRCLWRQPIAPKWIR